MRWYYSEREKCNNESEFLLRLAIRVAGDLSPVASSFRRTSPQKELEMLWR